MMLVYLWFDVFSFNCYCILDNVFAIKTWVKNKLAVEESVIDKQFDIPETFDYVDWVMRLEKLTAIYSVTKLHAVFDCFTLYLGLPH